MLQLAHANTILKLNMLNNILGYASTNSQMQI